MNPWSVCGRSGRSFTRVQGVGRKSGQLVAGFLSWLSQVRTNAPKGPQTILISGSSEFPKLHSVRTGTGPTALGLGSRSSYLNAVSGKPNGCAKIRVLLHQRQRRSRSCHDGKERYRFRLLCFSHKPTRHLSLRRPSISLRKRVLVLSVGSAPAAPLVARIMPWPQL